MLSFRQFLIESDKKIEFFAKQVGVPKEHIEQLAKIDPNPKKKHLGWLVGQYNMKKEHLLHMATHDHEDLTDRGNADVRLGLAINRKSYVHSDEDHDAYSSEISHAIINHKFNHPKTFEAIAGWARENHDKEILDKMSEHPDGAARAAVAAHSGKYFEKLKDDGDPRVQEVLAADHPEHFVNSPNVAIRKTAAMFGHKSPGIHDKLMNDPHEDVRAEVARNSSVHRPKMMNDDSQKVRNHITHRMNSDGSERPELYNHYARSKHADIRANAARFIGGGAEMYHLMNDPDEEVRASLAKNRHLPEIQREHLGNDTRSDHVRNTAINFGGRYGEKWALNR